LAYRYDGSNRLTGMTAVDGALTTFTYSSSQVLIQTVNSRTTTLALDASGNLTQVTNPDGGLHTFAYDANHLWVPKASSSVRLYTSRVALHGETGAFRRSVEWAAERKRVLLLAFSHQSRSCPVVGVRVVSA
jgi:YD repeat-containing protein